MSTQTLSSTKNRRRGNATLSSMRRVVHVALGTDVGGMEKLLVEFAKFSNRDRFEPTFVSLQHRGNIADEIERWGSPVFAFGKPEGLQPTLVLRLAKQLRELHADVVHTHNTAAMVYGVPAAKLAGVRTVIHTRHGQRLGASVRQNALFRWLAKGCDRVVSVCDDGTRLTVREGISPQRTSTICNGVDLSRFENVGPRADGPVTLVARLSEEKDVANLIRAMAIAIDSSKALRLRIIGDGSERAKLETLTQSLGLERVVEFLGRRSDVADLLAQASVFVLPSRSEGISLTLLEAMARGLPVVATSVGGTPEVVVDGETGLLVPAGDVVALADAIVELNQHAEAAAEMGRQGRKRVEQHFTIERMVHEYERLYEAESNA
ncbi:GT4 family glycosyltransferase PelF [Aporhodopirellula aestuarii]|uniref:GT4 family glycosyltransferase PelF n=1 Tax=Aporhodopirellula aestuarii TaxID=2950107 RepID=A0ABT0UEF4_9BACT|nr:GT4 family glycosyltransferase PelF [Aporhodopirellula aestuarii]MCM2374830.1 GT4 family glycosyltransferase PelF [Aporhodopirellula aestuarii]